MNIRDILAAQMALSGAKPLTAAPGHTSMEQLTNRMTQEAVINGSKAVEINHFLGAIIGHPSGPTRFHLAEALREEGLRETEVRERLGLKEYDHTVELSQGIPRSPELEGIFMYARIFAKQREDTLCINDLLAAAVLKLTGTHGVQAIDSTGLARILARHIKATYYL